MRLYDLSSVIRNEGMETAPVEIDYVSHEVAARQMSKDLGIAVNALPGEGMLPSDEVVTISSHYGTHVDAPTHYGDVIEGQPAKTVDAMELAPLFADGVLLDFSALGVEPITVSLLATEFERIGHDPQPGDIVLTRVGIEEHYYDDPLIRERGAGLDEQALRWLLARGVTVTGTDSLTQDMPIPWMEERIRSGDPDAYFPVHRIGGETNYVHIEKASGLRSLPGPLGYRVAALPIKVEGGSGAWARFLGVEGLTPPPIAAALYDVSQPIRRASMEPQKSLVVTHGRARRQRQWAKHLKMRVQEITARGSWDLVTASTRAGTHMEAPYRFGPVCAGSDAKTIDQIPLEWCIGPAVVLDVSSGPRELTVDIAELKNALSRVGHSIRAGDFVILRTGAEAHFDGDPNFAEAGRGLNRESFLWLLEQGVRLIGTDAETLDRPMSAMLKDFAAGDRAALMPVQLAAREREHVQVLKLGHLAGLPRATDLTLFAAPVKIEGAGSGWARAAVLAR